jgi:transcriptional regulator with XRE-family HTH domain
MTKQEVGRKARELREKAGLSQAELAEVTGVPQPAISGIERGAAAQATAEAFVDLIAETPPEKLREMVKAATTKKVEKVAKLPEQKTALAREIIGFRKRTGMSNALIGDVLNGISAGYVSQLISGYLPSKERVAQYRAAMAKYEGCKVPVEQAVSDKPHAAPPKPAPKPEPKLITPEIIEERVVQPDPEVARKHYGIGAPPVATSVPPSTAKIPPMTAVEARGTFLPNGTNLAPYLTIDGNTMHVFTLVPGGVFLSKLTAKENA